MAAKKLRIAIYGGDERNESLDWPEHLDIRIYPYKSPRTLERLQESASSGTLDHIVVLTGYIGHGYASGVKNLGVPLTPFARSPGQLAREIGRMFPPPKDTSPLMAPSRVDEPMTGAGRQYLPKLTVEAVAAQAVESGAVPAPIVPMFEHVVDDPPRKDETLGQALRRILAAERPPMTQSDLCRLIDKPQATVSSWMRDAALPRDMGPLVDLWPELARFDLEHEHKEPPPPKPPSPFGREAPVHQLTAEDAEKLRAQETGEPTREELLQFIRSVKVEPRPHMPDGLREALDRWWRSKQALKAAEKEAREAEAALLLLAGDAGKP